MFVIYGWGHQTKEDYGATLPIKCPNCNNDVVWHLVRSKIWATIFFIPVFPYNSEYYLQCEICSNGLVLKGPQIDIAKRLNRVTLSCINKEITQEQYLTRANEINLLEHLKPQLIVSHFMDNSKAKQAGIMIGDVINKVCGKDIKTVEDVRQALKDRVKGQSVKVELTRDGKEITIDIDLTENEKIGLYFK